MPKANLHDLKPAFLKLIDLLRKHRLQELGKTGLTHVSEEEVLGIENEFKIRTMLNALIADGVLTPFETLHGLEPYIVEETDTRTLVFNCLKTVEEIAAYRASLVIEGGLGVQIDEHGGSYYEVYRNGSESRERLSDREGTLLALLLEHANNPMPREDVARACDITPKQASDALNAIRKKMERLGFSKDEVYQMLPTYARDGIVFNR